MSDFPSVAKHCKNLLAKQAFGGAKKKQFAKQIWNWI